jgi:serine/threonine protein kinase
LSKDTSPVNTPNSGKHDITVSANLSTGLDLPVGRVINERYKVIEELGRGGMGVVYRVQQIALGREMALKTLDGTDIKDATWLRFQQEAKATSLLDHPNLISVHDYGIIDGKHPFFVMDLVEGVTLSQLISQSGPLSVEKAIPIFIQVCFGLAYAHELGIVHRDLKPSNIMVLKSEGGDGITPVKIVDFGIAKLKAPEGTEIQGLTKTGEIFGSPLYMSPEQCLGIKIDHRSDIYAIGCVLFEALTGLPPFMGNSALATMMMHQTEKPPTLKETTLGKEFPSEIQEIVSRLLEKEPNARYQSLGALAHDLSLLQQGNATLSLQKLQSTTEEQQAQSNKDVMMYAAVICLIISIFVGTAVYYIKDQIDHQHYTKNLESEIAAVKVADAKVAASQSPSISVQTSVITNERGEKVRRINFIKEAGFFNVVGNENPIVAKGQFEIPADKSIHFRSKLDEVFCKPGFFLQFQNDDITELTLSESALSDEDLKDIGNFQGLRYLDISATDVSDNCLVYLNRLPKLNSLNVGYNRITEAGILKVRRLLDLKELRTAELKTVSKLIENLKGSKQLEYLRFTRSNLTPSDIKNISAISSLRELNVEDCRGITDDSIKQLSIMPNLTTISISDTQVTGFCLHDLNKFKKLRYVVLNSALLTKTAVDKLKTVCPNITFVPAPLK